jgi:hypothetical protein
MQGNATFRHHNTAILSVEAVDAPIVVPSTRFDEELAGTYERLGLRAGLLEEVAGVIERRWWPEDVTFADAAALAGERAIQASGIDRGRIGLLIDTSVCRAHLEPSAAVDVHRQLSLAPSCLNFDLANACLGFVNAMHVAATMIDGGQITHALIVDGEGSRRTQEATLARLAGTGSTVEQVFAEFATLTLGSGGAAMVLAFDARAATRDVDALFEPDGPVLEAAREVAGEIDLPRSWLHNQASSYVSGRAGRGTPVYDHPNLRVMTTPAEHLLAMKVRAARSVRDADDIRLLLQILQKNHLAHGPSSKGFL